MTTLKLYNTETRAKEDIIPLEGNIIRMYTCGPTVYNYAHIGNFRTYVFEDLLRRTLKYFGMEVDQAMNLTDIDDKTLKGAIDNKISLAAFTEPYIEAFFQDLKTLNIEPVEHYPRATSFIPEMIKIIASLVEQGVAYTGADGSVYYAIRQFPSYGRLSHLHMHDLKEGASGICADEYDKENAADFVLWKSYEPARDGDIFWASPFGKGRPGWHIECSAMAIALLGKTLDIHVGGVDNMFPHHENEIAQSEAFTHQKFANHWLHAEHLLVDHKKMSKSLGNFYTLRDILQKGYTGPELRYLLLQTHYRTQLNFTLQGLDAARASLERLSDFITRIRSLSPTSAPSLEPLIATTEHRFKEALADDLNISQALAALFDFVREGNALADRNQISDPAAIISFLERLDTVLGVLPLQPAQESIPLELEDALRKREEARQAKNWKEADTWRDFIHSHGYLIEDTPTGMRLKKRQ